MTWFIIPKDYSRGSCATEDCGGVSEWRLESGGVGSDYCGNCKVKIEAWQRERHEEEQHEADMHEMERQAMEEHFMRHPHG